MLRSTDESDSGSENEVPDQLTSQRPAARKVSCSSIIAEKSIEGVAVSIGLPQASPANPAKRRKATQQPAGSALDAPLLGLCQNFSAL